MYVVTKTEGTFIWHGAAVLGRDYLKSIKVALNLYCEAKGDFLAGIALINPQREEQYRQLYNVKSFPIGNVRITMFTSTLVPKDTIWVTRDIRQVRENPRNKPILHHEE